MKSLITGNIRRGNPVPPCLNYAYAYSIRTGGDAYTNNHAYQDVPINQTGGSYVLSGWAKSNAVPDNVQSSSTTPETDRNKQFGLRAMITYSDNSTEYHYAPFNSDVKEWQFLSLAIVPKKATTKVTSIRVICAFEKNDNGAWFDNLCLTKEVAQTMAYDKWGNTTQIKVQSTDNTGNMIPTDWNSGILLARYSYYGENGLLQKMTYGNSDNVSYYYDLYGRPVRIIHSDDQ